MEKELSSRKRKILQTLIESYILKPEPVSSGELKDNFLPDVSSATIRSELATLEDMGYLIQPHISAGRVPSNKAYQFYVEKLMRAEPIKEGEIDRIRAKFNDKLLCVEDIVRTTAKLICDETNYTSIVVLNDIENITIKEIKLVSIGEGIALVLIITDSGVLKDNVIELNSFKTQNELTLANNILNKVFATRTVKEASKSKLAIDDEMDVYKDLFDSVISILENYSVQKNKQVFLEGANKYMEYPESNNIESVKKFMTLIEKKEEIAQLINNNQNINFNFNIDGCKENDCALVTAKYSINGKEVGHTGIIGPTRMDYNKVFRIIEIINKVINDVTINKIDVIKEEINDK